tara:strand:+ start:552 stop:839 length:288 start_codon:yes stop_codon:yes gene_type:complete
MTEYNQTSSCPCDGDIQPSSIGEETQFSCFVRTNCRENNDIFLAALITIYGFDFQPMVSFMLFSPTGAFKQVIQQSNLSTVWSDDTNIVRRNIVP